MMQDAPPPDWIEGPEWKQDFFARFGTSRWLDREPLKGPKDYNTLKLLRHSGRNKFDSYRFSLRFC